jgi:hypothetical protein
MVACHRSPNYGRLSIESGFESCSVTEPQTLRPCGLVFRRRNSIRRDQLHPAATSVPLLTDDSQIGANLRVCADEEDRADFDQRS